MAKNSREHEFHECSILKPDKPNQEIRRAMAVRKITQRDLYRHMNGGSLSGVSRMSVWLSKKELLPIQKQFILAEIIRMPDGHGNTITEEQQRQIMEIFNSIKG